MPNLITLGNLLSGCFSIASASENQYLVSIIWILAGMAFDFLDGTAARILQVESPLGKELDSFSDLVSFGLAPAFLIFHLLVHDLNGSFSGNYVPYLSWLIVIFSALRLAWFNLGGGQDSSGFIGLPTPANGLLACTLPMAKLFNPNAYQYILEKPFLLLFFLILSSVLLVLPIPLLTLKFKGLSWSQNKVRYNFLVYLIFGIGIIFWLGEISLIIPFIIISYFIFSCIYNLINKKNEQVSSRN